MDSKGASQALNALKSAKKYNVSENANLFDLSLQNKELKYITVNMLSRNLKLIDLQNNKLESLPEEVSDLCFLEKLKVDHNVLKVLPYRLDKLTNLNTLTASNNRLEFLPPSLESLEKLEILLLNDNKIQNLPKRIG